MQFKRVDEKYSKTVSYKITPDTCRDQGRTITVDEINMKLHVSRRDVIPKESPLKKICKVAHPTSNVQEDDSMKEINFEADVDASYQQLTVLLPDVKKLESLKVIFHSINF